MKPKRWHSCNVLNPGPAEMQLWQFPAHNGRAEAVAVAEHRQAPNMLLPARLVRKNWQTLWRRKLNIAWLPAEQAFLRVLHLPAGDPKELLAMVELQLEKISPLPATQVLWTIELIPERPQSARPAGSSDAPQTTVLVVIVARETVAEFLGRIESAGYLADRIEVPLLHELLAVQAHQDGAWLYLAAQGLSARGIVAWWRDGRLQNIDLLHLPEAENRAEALGVQLSRMAWAGEFEGWLPGAEHWNLAADDITAALWQPSLEAWSGRPVQRVSPTPAAQLASLSAYRATCSLSLANLLPDEFALRYRQLFVDRLWMRAMAAIMVIYGIALGGYFLAVAVVRQQESNFGATAASLAPSYTNALELRAKADILQEQVNLKYAALDCWKAVSDALPESIQLLQFSFQAGRTVTLQGTVPADSQNEVNNFNSQLKKALLGKQPLFSSVDAASFSSVGSAVQANSASGASTARWMFRCELNRTDIP